MFVCWHTSLQVKTNNQNNWSVTNQTEYTGLRLVRDSLRTHFLYRRFVGESRTIPGGVVEFWLFDVPNRSDPIPQTADIKSGYRGRESRTNRCTTDRTSGMRLKGLLVLPLPEIISTKRSRLWLNMIYGRQVHKGHGLPRRSRQLRKISVKI